MNKSGVSFANPLPVEGSCQKPDVHVSDGAFFFLRAKSFCYLGRERFYRCNPALYGDASDGSVDIACQTVLKGRCNLQREQGEANRFNGVHTNLCCFTQRARHCVAVSLLYDGRGQLSEGVFKIIHLRLASRAEWRDTRIMDQMGEFIRALYSLRECKSDSPHCGPPPLASRR